MKALCIFLIALSVYLVDYKVFLTGNDARINVHLPVAILKYGRFIIPAEKFPRLFNWGLNTNTGWQNVNYENFDVLMRVRPDLLSFGLLTPRPRVYSLAWTQNPAEFANTYGIGVGIAALPFYAAIAAYDRKLLDNIKVLWFTGKVAAATYVALSAMLVFLILCLLCSQRIAFLVSLFYALGTCVYSVASQTLWQQTPSIFFVTLATYFFLRSEHLQMIARANESKKAPLPRQGWHQPNFALNLPSLMQLLNFDTVLCGLAVGLAAFCRPTNFLLVPLFGSYFFLLRRQRALAFLLGVLPMLIIQFYYNFVIFGHMTKFGQTEIGRNIAQFKTGLAEVWQWNFRESIPGMLFSPSRGLFFFSPLLIIGILGVWEIFKNKKWLPFRYLIPIPLTFFLIQASWFDWWGGWSYGYRTLLEACPFLCLFLAPALEKNRSLWRRSAFALLFVWSLSVQFVGAYSYDYTWNSRPCDVDRATCRFRLWTLKDNEIFFYATNLSRSRQVKLRNVEAWIR